MNITDRINEVIDGLTGNPAAHQWIADLEDIRAGVDELTAAAWACTQAKQDRAADVAELVEAAETMQERIAYYASLGSGADQNIEDWAYTDNSGDMARLRAALAAMGGKV